MMTQLYSVALAIAFGISAVTVLALSRTIGSIEHT